MSADVQSGDQNVYLFVKWDGERTVEVRLPYAQYQNITCGLCGNFNGNLTDEFLMPDGELVSACLVIGFALLGAILDYIVMVI